MSVVPSSLHTKKWRMDQSWYHDGKHNECEYFQIQCVELITGMKFVQPTHLRINTMTLEFCHKKYPMKDNDGYEWTEDFDGLFEHNLHKFYINLKFVCGDGGAQTRTLREIYHFIATQLKYIATQTNDKNIYFVNILDGDTSHKNMSKFRHLFKHHSFGMDRVFVGDMAEFKEFWTNIIINKQPKEIKLSTEIQMNKKQVLGQFFTTNYEKILKDLYIPSDITHIIEPFAGAGDLINFISNKSVIIESYDIDPKNDCVVRRDTLQDPPCYDNKFILTNPPYLARNKCKDKKYFEKYQVDDLYKCFIKQLVNSNASGGIVIIPVNFWCSVRKADKDLRRDFLKKYNIVRLNIFEEPVFSDTTYSVCAFQFEKRQEEHTHLNVYIYPVEKHILADLNTTNNFLIGGDIYNLKRTFTYNITRLTKYNKDKTHTNILLKCIDDEHPIGLSIVSKEDIYIDDTPKLSARSYATLVIEPPISLEQQQLLVYNFNTLLYNFRNKFHSLFLSNYRENQRKRISFDLAYHIVGHLLEKLNEPDH